MSDQRKFIARWVGQGFTHHMGGKHPYLYRQDVGRIILSKTPSDHRTLKNTETRIRRMIRDSASRP